MEQRMDPDVRAGRAVDIVLIPELGRLIRDLPFHVPAARRKVALLRARRLLVAPDADDDAGVIVLGQERLQRILLERRAALDARRPAIGIGPARGQDRLVAIHDQPQIPLPHHAVAKLDHLRNLVAGIDMHERERHVTEERLPGQPQQDRGVLTHAPEHREVGELRVGLPEHEHRLVFEARQVIGAVRHGIPGIIG
jgi:hypothetical protein